MKNDDLYEDYPGQYIDGPDDAMEPLPPYTFEGKIFPTAYARDEYIRAVMNDKED